MNIKLNKKKQRQVRQLLFLENIFYLDALPT